MQLSLANKIALAILRNCYRMVNITKTNYQVIVTNNACVFLPLIFVDFNRLKI